MCIYVVFSILFARTQKPQAPKGAQDLQDSCLTWHFKLQAKRISICLVEFLRSKNCTDQSLSRQTEKKNQVEKEKHAGTFLVNS